jgi:hypothetical protein
MTTAHHSPRPDVSEMVAVHQALRDTLGCAPQLVLGVEAADGDRLGVITNFYLLGLHRERPPPRADRLDGHHWRLLRL